MATIREEASGSHESCNIEMAEELKRTTKQERNQILKDAGLTLPEEPSVGQVLAMKADVGIPWSKLRTLRRFAFQY